MELFEPKEKKDRIDVVGASLLGLMGVGAVVFFAVAIIGELNDPKKSPEGRAAITKAFKEDGLPAMTDENGWVVSNEGLRDNDNITLDFGSCLLPYVSYDLIKNENGEYLGIDRYYFRLKTNGILYSFANKEELDNILGDKPCQTLAASGN